MFAAITGDIISSKKLELADRDEINSLLITDFKTLSKTYKLHFPFEFLRGDSFQGVATELAYALQLALHVKSIFKKNGIGDSLTLRKPNAQNKSREDKRKNWRIYDNLDIRISVGIGKIQYLKDVLSISDGEALQFSGRKLEQMKHKGQKIAVTTGFKELDRELSVELKLLDAITDKWTPLSAEVAYYLMLGNNETETAEILKISQSAVNQRKQTANWDAIEVLLDNFKYLISRNYNPSKAHKNEY